jgi:hypothetical protein
LLSKCARARLSNDTILLGIASGLLILVSNDSVRVDQFASTSDRSIMAASTGGALRIF